MAYFANIYYDGMSIEECSRRICKTLTEMGLTYRESSDQIYALVPMSGASWGEEMTIYFSKDYFSVESKCVGKLQVIDWGKNKRNVNNFIKIYNQMK
ncbi:MAG: hypothetical protein IJW31_02305 [Lentisphaeria bacterium]|nr:hypothetical protein [Lentisphaeria bacterium]